jgi:hypothetical protein
MVGADGHGRHEGNHDDVCAQDKVGGSGHFPAIFQTPNFAKRRALPDRSDRA